MNVAEKQTREVEIHTVTFHAYKNWLYLRGADGLMDYVSSYEEVLEQVKCNKTALEIVQRAMNLFVLPHAVPAILDLVEIFGKPIVFNVPVSN